MDTKLSQDIPHMRNFGRTVLINRDFIVVGDCVYGDPMKGAVFVYAFDAPSSSWRLNANITNEDCDQWFGNSCGVLYAGLVIVCPREVSGLEQYTTMKEIMP